MPKFTPEKLGFGQPNAAAASSGITTGTMNGHHATGGIIGEYQEPDGKVYRSHTWTQTEENNPTGKQARTHVPANFTISALSGTYPAHIQYMIAGSGGSGGGDRGAGGGGGGVRTNVPGAAQGGGVSVDPSTNAPVAAQSYNMECAPQPYYLGNWPNPGGPKGGPAGGDGYPGSGTRILSGGIAVGGGGGGGSGRGAAGSGSAGQSSNSPGTYFQPNGRGGGTAASPVPEGGSGGGGTAQPGATVDGGEGGSYGYDGGPGASGGTGGGGGGGAGAVGETSTSSTGKDGGAGVESKIFGGPAYPMYFGCGGGGAPSPGPGSEGLGGSPTPHYPFGIGGCRDTGSFVGPQPTRPFVDYTIKGGHSGIDGTGSGGGGGDGGVNPSGGSGGSGIISIRYQIGDASTGGMLFTQKATGGIVSNFGGFTFHTFIFSGDFVVTDGPLSCEVLGVGGGGGGAAGNGAAGGGGSGGVFIATAVPYTNATYTITVGNGGRSHGSASTHNSPARQGWPSVVPYAPTGSLIALGGGGGRLWSSGGQNVVINGGAGGGGAGPSAPNNTKGEGTQPTQNPGTPFPITQYGSDGGDGNDTGYRGGGGGGADPSGGIPGGEGSEGCAGMILPAKYRNPMSPNGLGAYNAPSSAGYWIAGGGGGGTESGSPITASKDGTNGKATLGGGGRAGFETPSQPYFIQCGVNGQANTGGGGGDGYWLSGVPRSGGCGGSGIVIISYPDSA